VFAGVISGIFLAAFIMLLIHMHLLRRKARANSNSDLSPAQQQQQQQQQRQEAASRRQRRRRYDHDPDDGDDDDELEDLASEKSTTSFSVSSLSLEPNQPIFVDVVVIEESSVCGTTTGAGGAQTGLQFILTPPTPGR
jgi:mannitol-specific phosphotransferase system IIBC component